MPGPDGVLVVAGFAVLVGRCVVLDLLQKSEELLQVFDFLEVDRDEQLVDDDLLALTGAALIAALVLVLLPAAEVDLLLRLAVKSALHLLEALVHRLCRGVAASVRP